MGQEDLAAGVISQCPSTYNRVRLMQRQPLVAGNFFQAARPEPKCSQVRPLLGDDLETRGQVTPEAAWPKDLLLC